jgi:hypothetical protein
MTPVEQRQLERYRNACPRIIPVLDRDEMYRQLDVMRCANDGLPILSKRGGGYRHDPDAVRDLARKERGER